MKVVQAKKTRVAEGEKRRKEVLDSRASNELALETLS